MTERRPDPRARDEAALLDLLLGELDAAEKAALEARFEADPALAAARGWTESVLAAERRAFEPPMPQGVWETDAARVAARVRDEARALEAPRAYRPVAAVRSRGWARVLALSVAAHVVLLGVIALVSGGGAPVNEGAGPTVALRGVEDFRESDTDYADHDTVVRYVPIVYDDVDGPTDRIIMSEQETLAEVLPLEAGAPRLQPDPRVNDHPVGVYVPMSRRKHVPTKKSRLRLLGFNAQGTMRAVEKGLSFLSGEQRRDGSFAAGGGRGALEQTSLAMLAFLADGHCSRHGAGDVHGKVVERGIAWVRGRLDKLDDRGQELGLATMALCEDYMLSYGWLSPAEAQRRANEIGGLVDRLREASGTAPIVAPWRTWALDAAGRAGVIEATRDDRRLFTAWVQEASTANGTLSSTSAFGALAVSTALLYLERGVDKPRFLDWSRAHAEALVDRLNPIGKAKTGDPVGETASILLALQVAYRTY